MKRCFKCGEEKPLSKFYKHKAMADGFLGKCKQCTKNDVTRHRNSNLDEVRAYDRSRGSRQTKAYRDRYTAENPEKYKAHIMVSNAVRDGKLKKEPCEVCGSKHRIHGHHDNYDHPLTVRWLCAVHHHEAHKS